MAEDRIRSALEDALRAMGAGDAEVHLERPRDPSHGDLASNVALTLASMLKRPPRQIAEEIVSRIELEGTGATAVEIAGPGFLNFRLGRDAVGTLLLEVLRGDDGYGGHDVGEGRKLMVEFVSANPTGPLHIGHGRQAALGDAIAALLEWTGWEVHREFYYNDAGTQMEMLARSVHARYHQYLGDDRPVPEGGYHGEYVLEIAAQLVQEVGERWRGDESREALDAMRLFAARVLREEQDRDLEEFRIHFDHHFLESSLYEEGRIEETVGRLRGTGLVYERDDAVWLRTTDFGDQKDRVMIRRDGTPTYFVPDVAYHLTKWDRGFRHAINVQGADHHGTVDRMRTGLRALGLPDGWPEWVLHQMVTVERGGEEVKFSKRAGDYVTLRDLFDQVGVDVTRYFFQMRKAGAHLVFDLDQALDQSEKNPVYKIQYAHARMCSIFRKAGVERDGLDAGAAEVDRLEHPLERELIKQLTEFPDVVRRAAEGRAPHLLCDYLEQTAGAVNSWYHAGNPTRDPGLAVLADDASLRAARLVLARAVQIVLRNGLRVLAITAPERMVRAEELVGEEGGS